MTGNKNNLKNTLQSPQSTKPLVNRIPPQINNFNKPIFKGPNFNTSNAFRNQNRGSGGK